MGPRWGDDTPTSDLCNLRLMSTRLRDAAQDAFVKRYFQYRCIMLQRNSLENLIAISGHPVFGPAVEHLSIRLYHWTSSPQLATSDPPREGTPAQEYVVEEEDMKEKDLEKEYAEEPGVDLQAYHRLMEDQRFMMDSGLTTTYLVHAVIALPALKTVAVNEELTPWGLADLMRQTGLRLTVTLKTLESMQFANDAIRAIVQAIILTDKPLEELELCPGFRYGYPFNPIMLTFSPAVQPLLEISHPCLHTLGIMISPGEESFENDLSHVLQFVALFPGLEGLWFQFEPIDEPDYFAPLFQRLRVPCLRHLRLTGLECTADDLLDFLRAHRLQHVALTGVDVVDGYGEGWRGFLAAIRDEALTDSLEMDHCREEREYVGYREPGNEGPVNREILLISCGILRASLDWTTMINGLVIGDGQDSEEDDDDEESD